MPELPEVETMCRGLRPIIGAKIEKVIRPQIAVKSIRFEPTFEILASRLQGQEIKAIERRGKRVIVQVDCNYLVFQPKMTGLVCLTDPPDPGHIRMIWRLAPVGNSQRRPSSLHNEVVFWDRRGLGTISLWDAAELEQKLGDSVLGPDALSISCDELQQRGSRTKRSIKVALLDQKLVAGVGNLYASEILHRIGLHPEVPAEKLNSRQWQQLHSAMLEILHEAIRYEGSTLSDGTYRNALNESGGYQNHHQVYDRAGELCRTCGRQEIMRIVQAQRATFYCPACQRKNKR